MTIYAKIKYEPIDGFESAFDSAGSVEKPIATGNDLPILLHRFANAIGLEIDEARIYMRDGTYYSSVELGPQEHDGPKNKGTIH